MGLGSYTFYILVGTWPAHVASAVAGNPPEISEFILFFGQWNSNHMAGDLRLFITAMAAGSLGSLLHSLPSFADFVGNGKFKCSWIWWYILRPFIGMGLALLFYLVLRGGLVSPNGQTSANSVDVIGLVNPYGVAAVSAMAGMFSKQATDKLREIFDTLFKTDKKVDRNDPLGGEAPTIDGSDPSSLTKSSATRKLTLKGKGFTKDSSVTINDESRTFNYIDDKTIEVTLNDKDVSNAGTLSIVVVNPEASGGKSEAFKLNVT